MKRKTEFTFRKNGKGRWTATFFRDGQERLRATIDGVASAAAASARWLRKLSAMLNGK